MSNIVLKNWYQLDFKIKNPVEDLEKVDSIMKELKSQKLISKWFFLYERPNKVPTIRVRMCSNKKSALQKRLIKLTKDKSLTVYERLPFSDYVESAETLFNEEVVERFANIMSEVTLLTIRKLKNQIRFGNYRMIERISHCLFNNMATLSYKSEEYFLKQRLKERVKLSFDGDFENKIIKKRRNGAS